MPDFQSADAVADQVAPQDESADLRRRLQIFRRVAPAATHCRLPRPAGWKPTTLALRSKVERVPRIAAQANTPQGNQVASLRCPISTNLE
jgi:hypothetical protein